MLGPIDIEDWADSSSDMRARVRQRPEFIEMKTNPGLKRLESLTEQDFNLLARFCAEESLSDDEIDLLIEALHA
jgi:hypothetical protein